MLQWSDQGLTMAIEKDVDKSLSAEPKPNRWYTVTAITVHSTRILARDEDEAREIAARTYPAASAVVIERGNRETD